MDLFVAEWRQSKGLSQSALARMAGISRQTLAAIEMRTTVRPHRSTLSIIAHVLGCQMDNLYTRPESPAVQEPNE